MADSVNPENRLGALSSRTVRALNRENLTLRLSWQVVSANLPPASPVRRV
jgi:hypothetical protein